MKPAYSMSRLHTNANPITLSKNLTQYFSPFLAPLLETAGRYAMILQLAHLIAAASSYLADGVALVTTSLRRTGYVETSLLDDCLVGNDASSAG
jgi:hypothetical protein